MAGDQGVIVVAAMLGLATAVFVLRRWSGRMMEEMVVQSDWFVPVVPSAEDIPEEIMDESHLFIGS